MRLSLRVLEGLRALVQTAPAQAAQVRLNPSSAGAATQTAAAANARPFGGLLIGKKKFSPGVTAIVDFIPLPAPAYQTNSSQLVFLSEWIDEAVATCPPDYKVVGFYRTSTDDLIRLSPDDLKLIQQRFTDPSSVFLVIAPGETRSTAGFFCWQNGWIPDNCRLAFPFSADELASGGWRIQGGQSLSERLAELGAPVSRLIAALATKPRPAIPRVVWTQVLPVALVVAFAATAGILLRHSGRGSHASAAIDPSVALRVERVGESFVLSWDPTASQILSAAGGSLEIHEGTKPVSFLSLTTDQLRTGVLAYGSYPYSDSAQFKLKIVGAAGTPSIEATAAPSPSEPVATPEKVPPVASDPSAAFAARAPRPRRARPADEEANYPPIPIPAWSEQPPKQSFTADLQREPAQIEPPSFPAMPAPVIRTFVPPAARPSETVAPEPASLPDPPPLIGRLKTPIGMVPFVLATSLPPNTSAPPKAEDSNAAPMRPLVISESLPGLLSITSEPSGASVEINHVFAGTTPLAVQISPVGLGFTVTITKSGFAKWSIQSVAMDQPYSLHARLRQQ